MCYDLTNWLVQNTTLSYNLPSESFDGELAAAFMLNFKGSWTNAFDVKKTKIGKFHNSDNTSSEVQFMTGSESGIELLDSKEMIAFKRELGVNRGFRIFNYTITFLLPKEDYSIDECLNRLIQERCNMGYFENMDSKAVGNLTIPKINLNLVTDVASVCEIMGEEEKCSLSEMPIEEIVDGKTLHVSNLIQCTSISFDESGAIGEDAFEGDVKADGRPFKNHVDVVIDKPFMFFVSESYSNAMLLFGAVNKL
ncbi:MAG: hypothetical protein NC339_08595 [Muribaculaceae bacterium]|nr:hypothetical protein [Muribaculaceae bacterium]